MIDYTAEHVNVGGIQSQTPSLSCCVYDTYILGLKHARLIREITFKNPSPSSKIEVDFLFSEHIFSHFCSNFVGRIDNQNVKLELIENKDYTKHFVIQKQSQFLEPNKELKIVIECEWKNFVNFLNDCLICFSYNQLVFYHLTIQDLSLNDRKYKILIDGKPYNQQEIQINKSSIEFFSNKVKVINPKIGISIRLLIANTPLKLEVLDSLFKKKNDIFKNYVVVFIQHLLSDFIHLIEKFELYGTEKDSVFICGIPYSTKETTIEYLSLSGYSHIYSPSEYPFEEFYYQMLRDSIKSAIETNKKVIVVEDGGYIFPALHTESEFISHQDLFTLIVEQTTNGIDRDLGLIKKSNLTTFIPVIDVAKSDLKKILESRLIGKTVVNNIEQLLAKDFCGIEGKVIGLVGYGNTGEFIVEQLLYRGATVKIFEPKDSREVIAKFKGSITTCDSVPETIKESDIVIESTGNSIAWANMHELSLFKNASYYLSSSSKRLGINYNDLDKFSNETINLPGIGKKYYLNNKNYITLLADGYPINFFMGESVPDYQIQFIITLLFGAAYLGVKNISSLSSKIINMNEDGDAFGYKSLQEDIQKNYKYTKR